MNTEENLSPDQALQEIGRVVAYVITMLLAFTFGAFIVPHQPAPGWVVALVTISVVAGLPLLYAAWRVLGQR